MSYYSRRGDDGTTGWLGKGRLKKYDLRIEAVGTLDEASAAMGLARADCARSSRGNHAAGGAARSVSADGRSLSGTGAG